MWVHLQRFKEYLNKGEDWRNLCLVKRLIFKTDFIERKNKGFAACSGSEYGQIADLCEWDGNLKQNGH
jgi:hypothetical protein